MSDVALTMLVWDVQQTNLKSYLKKNKLKGYMKLVSENVIAVAANGLTENGEKMSLKTSNELQTRTLLLVYSEDHGWGANVYFKGEPTGSFFLEYDTPLDNNWEDDVFRDFAANQRSLSELSNCLNSGNEEAIYNDSWNLFVETLGIDISNDYNFDYLERLSEGILIQSGIEMISARKKSSLKKLLKKYLEPFFIERGYTENSTSYLPYDYTYLKSVNGFFVGCMIDKNEDSIHISVKTLLRNVPVFYPGERYFSNEEDLAKILIESKEQFEKKLIEYEDELNFDAFDSAKIFAEYMNDYLITKDYRMIESSIDQLSGGKVLYRRDNCDHNILFSHSNYYLGLSVASIKGGIKEKIYIHDEAGNSLTRGFKNKAEYIDLLEKYKVELDNCYS